MENQTSFNFDNKKVNLPNTTDWLNMRLDDFEVMEDIKIDNKILSVPRVVANLLQRMNDRNRDLTKQVEILNKALNLSK